jgi:hypothetical protein
MIETEAVETVRYSTEAQRFIGELNSRVERIFENVRKQGFWIAIFSEQTTNEELRSILCELFLSVYWYQKHTTEASFLMLGRLPKYEQRLMRTLLAHKVEEAEHGEWALRDYLALGGSEATAISLPSPATFAVAAVWWRMAGVEEPLGYLGAEHLFEYLTVLVSAALMPELKKRHFDLSRIDFIVEHATEDVKHTNLIRHWIGECCTGYPDSVHSMHRCFDYFESVYPLPVWQEAYDRALAKTAESR